MGRSWVTNSLISLSLCSLFSAAVHAQLVEWPISSGGNGHYYEVVMFEGGSRTWDEAGSSICCGGYLATITSAAENEFVADLLFQYPTCIEAFLGGYQPDPDVPPDEGWEWVTGEAWDYTNWSPGEPNDACPPEIHLGMFGLGVELNHAIAVPGCWNDENCMPNFFNGMVVEYENPPVSNIWFVDDDAASGGDGQTWETAFEHLQDALDGAAVGDQVWVASGVYRPTARTESTDSRSAVFQLRSGVQAYGGLAGDEDPASFDLNDRDFVANETVLDGDLEGDDGPDFANYADNSYHVIDGGSVNSQTRVDGFTIRGGNADAEDLPDNSGGGILAQGGSPMVSHCRLVENRAAQGGAGYSSAGSALQLEDCHIEGNTATTYVGGVYLHTDTTSRLERCTFQSNTCPTGAGGAVLSWLTGPTVIRDCAFVNNAAVTGGGMLVGGCSPAIEGCSFVDNTAVNGGGIRTFDECGSTITSCSFSANVATDWGGGIVATNQSYLTLHSCVFFGNSSGIGGGGIYLYTVSPMITNSVFSGNTSADGGAFYDYQSSPYLVNCTLSRNTAVNSGGGLFSEDNCWPAAVNCVFWQNQAQQGTGEDAQIFNQNGSWTMLDYSCVQGWTGGLGGTGNTGAAPEFVDDDGADDVIGTSDDDLRLWPTSPVINAGDDTAIPEGVATDLDGNPRIQGCQVDMGAFELSRVWADIDIDGDVDLPDFIHMQVCFGGSEAPQPDCAAIADLDCHGFVDLSDVGILVGLMTGP